MPHCRFWSSIPSRNPEGWSTTQRVMQIKYAPYFQILVQLASREQALCKVKEFLEVLAVWVNQSVLKEMVDDGEIQQLPAGGSRGGHSRDKSPSNSTGSGDDSVQLTLGPDGLDIFNTRRTERVLEMKNG